MKYVSFRGGMAITVRETALTCHRNLQHNEEISRFMRNLSE